MPDSKGNYTPPESGDLPEYGKKILSEVYSKNRREHPDWPKEKCAKIAWAAVENAGYHKDKSDHWVKKSDDKLTKAQWDHDLPNILNSKRVIEMQFHVPVVDNDREFITAQAMADALEDYRHFPIISEFHKERPVGIAERIWQTGKDEFKAIARIREDPSVDDVWDKIERGLYNQVSIAGRRTEFSQECNLHQSLRSADRPCRTTGLRLDSISVCDGSARNDHTNLTVVKAVPDDPLAFEYTTSLVLTQVKDTLIKAETSNSQLIHPVTDGTKRKAGDKGEKVMEKCNEPPVKKGDEKEDMKEKEMDEEKEQKGEAGEPEKEEMEKAPEPPKKPEETAKADPFGEVVSMIKEMKAVLDRLVESDKKVHTTMKAVPEVPAKPDKVEKAEDKPPKPTPADSNVPDPVTVQKAVMEQDFQKAFDAAISPLKLEIETLKKAMETTNAKLEEYGNDPITKSGIRIFPLNVDNDGNPVMGNAGAVAEATKQAVKK